MKTLRAILILTLLSGCEHSHQPRYVDRSPRYEPIYRLSPVRRDRYRIRESYYDRYYAGPLSRTQMRLEMNRRQIMHGSGCYLEWCPRRR